MLKEWKKGIDLKAKLNESKPKPSLMKVNLTN